MEIPKTTLAEWDEEGVYVYQAFNNEIADWALENGKFGGPSFNPHRMTWIKPSFAWVLYRSGYGMKDENQQRILRIKLSHDSFASIGSQCTYCQVAAKDVIGRVQWDPERVLYNPENSSPLRPKKIQKRAIQIGMKGVLSEQYVNSIMSIEDVTDLALKVAKAHQEILNGNNHALDEIRSLLPNEREYTVITPLPDERDALS